MSENDLTAITSMPEVSTLQPRTVESVKSDIDAWFSIRKYVETQFSKILVEGKDWYEVTNKRTGDVKRSLGKPGAEKLASLPMFQFSHSYVVDTEAMVALGIQKGIVLRCTLRYRDGSFAGEGFGARTLQQDYNDINKCMKMARKSAYIDAVISCCGISDIVTQDIEDSEDWERTKRPAPKPKPKAAPKAKAEPKPAPKAEPPKEWESDVWKGYLRKIFDHKCWDKDRSERMHSVGKVLSAKQADGKDWYEQINLLRTEMKRRGAPVPKLPIEIGSWAIEHLNGE